MIEELDTDAFIDAGKFIDYVYALKVERDQLRAELSACATSVGNCELFRARIVALEGLLNRVRQADALSHNCPLWKAIDAALPELPK